MTPSKDPFTTTSDQRPTTSDLTTYEQRLTFNPSSTPVTHAPRFFIDRCFPLRSFDSGGGLRLLCLEDPSLEGLLEQSVQATCLGCELHGAVRVLVCGLARLHSSSN